MRVLQGEVAFLAEGQAAERLANLLSLSYEPMLAWSLDGPIEFWNAGAERLYGFSPDEAVGHSSHALLQTKFPIQFAELRSQLRGVHSWSGELRHICKDGREVIVDSRMQLLGDTVLEVNRDITDQKRIEAALDETEQRLRWLASIVESSDDAIVSKNRRHYYKLEQGCRARLRLHSRRGHRSAYYNCDPTRPRKRGT
jgi:PAS domain S-box-containing protein